MNPADLYLQVREKEGRIYPDQIVKQLPALAKDHPHRIEWSARDVSATKLILYLLRLTPPVFILELGCGNGWLTHKLSTIPGVHIWGVDRSGVELTQAARLFQSSNTGFLSTNIFEPPFIHNSFNIIILASVIQYFPDLQALILKLRPLLTTHGEIHVMDSPIYNGKELISARERTFNYYGRLGLPEMADHYFHHTFDELKIFSTHWIYRPNKLKARIAILMGKAISPFPWLSIS
jgi:SAM-dependent methyltransferase